MSSHLFVFALSVEWWMRLERPSLEEEERVIDGSAVQCPDLTPVCCDIELLLGRCVASAASPAAC